MRIAVFIKSTTFHKGYGGLETQNKVLCEGLVNKGHYVKVFSPRTKLTPEFSQELLNETAREAGVDYFFIPSEFRTLTNPFNSSNDWVTQSVRTFTQEHEKEPYDVVISQSSAGVGVIKNKRSLGVHVISISHGSILGEFKTKLSNTSSLKDLVRIFKDVFFVMKIYFGRQRDFILGSDRVVAVSKAVKRLIMEETFVDEDKVTVIYNGIDPSKFGEFSGEHGSEHGQKTRLIYVGRVVRSKGLFELVHALKELNKDNVLLNIVGDGEDMEKLRKEVEVLDLTDKVIFHGKLPYDRVVEKLFGSDIFVLPTLRVEGFPMTLPEAMFAGLPIIASDMGGVSDAVEDGRTGFLVRPKDREQLKEKLNILIDDVKLRRDMGSYGRTKAYQEFSLNTMIKKYEQVIQEVCL